MEIEHIDTRQILDSRGNPTVEADVWLSCGVFGRAAVPSGASTGSHEAHELRDNNKAFHGMSVYKALSSITDEIIPCLKGIRADDQFLLDQRMIDLDGTENKQRLGANAILAVSLACAHAAAKARNVLLYAHISDIAGNPHKSLPMPMMNILNGGKHAAHSTDVQESMVIPIGAETFSEAIRIGSEVFHSLKDTLEAKGYATTVGDEGGFAPAVKHGNTESLQLLTEAVEKAGYKPGKDVAFALDVASSEIYTDATYSFTADKKHFSSAQLIAWYSDLVERFPILSIEDGMAEDDWDGWTQLADKLPNIQLVGDDLLVTNVERIQKAINLRAANAVLIKPNQVGTLTETIRAIQLAKNSGWNTVISHRSGETEDITIAHIAIGTGAGQIKTGSLSRGERTAKHNELMRIEMIDPTLRLVNPFK